MCTITFHAYASGQYPGIGKSLTGHAFVTFNDSHGMVETWGFHPPGDFLIGTGELRNDAACIQHARVSCSVNVTNREYAVVRDVITRWIETPPYYGWRDCVGFAQDVAGAIPLNHGGWKIQWPKALIDYFDR